MPANERAPCDMAWPAWMTMLPDFRQIIKDARSVGEDRAKRLQALLKFSVFAVLVAGMVLGRQHMLNVYLLAQNRIRSN